MKEWLRNLMIDEQFPLDRKGLQAQGNEDDWGAGESGEQEDLPPAPTGVIAKPGNGRTIVSWELVPGAM